MALGCLSLLIGCVFFIYFLINKSIATAFIYAFVFFVLMIILAVIGSQIEENRKVKQRKYLLTLQPKEKQFRETQSFLSFDLLSKIAMDEQNRRIYLWAPENRDVQSLKDIPYRMPYQLFSYAYSDILAVEIIENGSRTSTVFRRSQSARFLLNGLQPTMLTSPREQSEGQRTYSLLLKLIMKDSVKPIHLIHFYIDSAKSPNKNSAIYQKAQNDLEHWFTVFHFIMKDIDKMEGYEHEDETCLLIDASRTIEMEKPNHFEIELEKPNKQSTNINNPKEVIFARAQLLSVLTQVTYIKLNEGLLLNNDTETKPTIKNSASYFDQLLEKNREQLHGDSNRD